MFVSKSCLTARVRAGSRAAMVYLVVFLLLVEHACGQGLCVHIIPTLYVGMAPTRPLSLNKYDGAELSNAASISPSRNITWPTSVSRHDNTLKGSKIHRYNDIREIAKPRFLHHHLLLLQ